MGGRRIQAFHLALSHTFPTWAGMFFPALSYGLLMYSQGFSIFYPLCMSALIFAGSMEFVTISLLSSAFNPFAALLLTLAVNGRHLFYGIAMLDVYRGTGWKKSFLIFGMCDEAFAINSSAKVPEEVDRGWFMFWVTAVNWISWVAGTTFGWFVGGVLPFSTEGVEFAMPAMFLAIVLSQWEESDDFRGHVPAIVGVVSALVCLIIFGPKNFILPTLLGMLFVFIVLHPCLADVKDDDGGIAGDVEAAEESSAMDVLMNRRAHPQISEDGVNGDSDVEGSR